MTLIFRKNSLLVFLIFLLLIIIIYVIYLNLAVKSLQNDIEIKNSLYDIQINNRITEIEQLNSQLDDLQNLLNIGLDLSSNENIFQTNDINEIERKYFLKLIPSSSPLKEVFITSKYGIRYHPILKEERVHSGIDFRAKEGTEIYTTAQGIIWETKNTDLGGYGKYITVLHSYGFKTFYAHLSEVFVKKGDVITKGTLLGLSGNTGRSSGPHLHYEVRYLDDRIDPSAFVYWNKKTFPTIFSKNENLIQWKKIFDLTKNDFNELKYKD